MGIKYDGPGATYETSTRHTYSSATNQTTHSTFAARLKEYETKETRQTSTPNFKKLKKSGKLIPHTYFEQTWIKGSAGSNSYNITETFPPGNEYQVYTVDQYYPPNEKWLLNPGDLQSYGRSCLPELQAAAAAIYEQGHDTLTALAELAKLKSMFRRMAGRLITLCKSGRVPPINLRNIAGGWLEFRYGWRTFVYDVIDLHRAIEEFDVKRELYSERAGTSYNTQVTGYLDGSFASGPWRSEWTDTASVSCRGSIAALVTPAQFRKNVITTGWELVPFSFIVDWFIGVGTWLSSMSFLANQREYVGSTGIKITVRREYTSGNLSNNPNFSGGWSSSASSEGVFNQRTPSQVSLMPTIKVKLDAFKIADLLAIIYRFL